MSQQVLRSFTSFIKQQRKQGLLCSFLHTNNLKANHTIAGEQNDTKTHQRALDKETQREVEHHGNFANRWWDVNGSMKGLHALNAIRVPFIRDGMVARGNVSPELVNSCDVLKGLNILEVGCGGGILTEQLARLGAHIIGIDLSDELIRVAREHLLKEAEPKLRDHIQYKIEPIHMHAKDNANYYDAVVVSEVLEHVKDKVAFLTASVQCLKPGGSIFITTLNKSVSMWIGGVLLCEYVFGIVPIGTHHWNKMISPLDVQRILDTMGCYTVLVNGSTYDFWSNTWRWINSTNLCYALQAIKTKL